MKIDSDVLIELLEKKQNETRITTDYGHGVLAGLTEAKDIIHRLVLEEQHDLR